MIDLKKIPSDAPEKFDKKTIKKENGEMTAKIIEYQRMMYAQGKYSLLVILQGMDASGKDGAVRKVFTGINPLGCKVAGFKKPTPEEFAHDFLWRIHQHTPEKGMIQIFNRSHYEDILVPTVEKYIDTKEKNRRYEAINNFEKLLTDNNTVIVKCYMHVSHERQLEKLNDRLANPRKFWKHNDGDRDSRAKWNDYMKVYHDIFKKTDTKHAPWHVIPSDQNWYKAYTLNKILLEAFESMDLKRPELETEKFAQQGEQEQSQEEHQQQQEK